MNIDRAVSPILTRGYLTLIGNTDFFILEFSIEINKERVEYIPTRPGIMKNPYRKDMNIYYKRFIIKCGEPPQYGVLWKNQHYLK